MAIKSPLSMPRRRLLDVAADLGNYRRAKSDVGYKMTVHNINVQPTRRVSVTQTSWYQVALTPPHSQSYRRIPCPAQQSPQTGWRAQ